MQPTNATIIVSGPNAAKFLQGQLCCDINNLQAKKQLGAYCNIKGRVVAIFNVNKQGDDFHLTMPSEIIQATIDDLNQYAKFTKIKLTPSTATSSFLIDELHNIKSGIPLIYTATIGKFLPHHLNLIALGAVSLTKGCYRGQEIVARMEYRGKIKRKLAHCVLDKNYKLGDKIELNNQSVSIVNIAADNLHFASLVT